jgi:hypothetical protein
MCKDTDVVAGALHGRCTRSQKATHLPGPDLWGGRAGASGTRSPPARPPPPRRRGRSKATTTLTKMVALGDDASRMVTVGAQLSLEQEVALVYFLRANADVFAWEPSDLIGVPREVIEHKLAGPSGRTPCEAKGSTSGPGAAGFHHTGGGEAEDGWGRLVYASSDLDSEPHGGAKGLREHRPQPPAQRTYSPCLGSTRLWTLW